MADITEYPEHEKIISVNGDMQMLDGFLVWLSEARAIEICESRGTQWHREWSPIHPGNTAGVHHEQLIAEFFGIAWDKYLAEQEALLEEAGPVPDRRP